MDTALLKPQSIGAQLHQKLREEIVFGRICPGTVLSEAEIALRFNVSRQPVREAFIRLAQEDLVEVRPQRGTYVRRIVAANVVDAHFVRESIEVAIAREAAKKADESTLPTLLALIDRQSRARTNAEFLEADEAMHHQLAVIAGRESAWKVIDQVKAQMDRVRYMSYVEVSPIDILIQQHQDIAQAVAAGDPDAAEAAVRRHIGEVLRQLPELAQRYPDMFES